MLTAHYYHYEQLPENWAVSSLNELCEIRNGFTPLRSNSAFWDNGTVPWFTINDVRQYGNIVNKTSQSITEIATSKERIVPPESVLICCTASIGEVAYSKIHLTTNQQFNGLTVKENRLIEPKYLYYFCKTLKEHLKMIAGATTFGFVSVGKLGSLSIPLPPPAEQIRIVAAIEAQLEVLNEIEETLS